jgi:glycerol-3-phosphate dehydrogenase (NAD(P)+)
VCAYPVSELPAALAGADLVISGVSSFGVEWFGQAVGPLLEAAGAPPVISVTKGLVDLPDGELITLPDALRAQLPASIRARASLNAIGGPCIAHELAARRQTGVVFTGRERPALEGIRALLATPYYHPWLSTDLTGVEVCAAMKNAYALGVGLAVGQMQAAGPDGLANMYNPQAALFGQACYEMRHLLHITGGGEDNAAWLPGAGDLYVTVFGGRTVALGKLLGSGMRFTQARKKMAGVTLESVEIVNRVTRALPKLAARRRADLADFPLLLHLQEIIQEDLPVDIPWDAFFAHI